MIAKLIASGETRESARRRAIEALRAYPILGIRTNIPFLIRLLEHPRFVRGEIDTGFIDAERPALVAGLDADPPPEVLAIAEIRNGVGSHLKRTVADPWQTLRGWRG
jgi:acetyl/propionyl-CoA carboxylase alpha subunit